MSARRLRTLGAALLWLGIWQALALIVGQPLLVPGPWETFTAFASLVGTASFWLSVWASFATIVCAFLGAFVCATALGALAATRPLLADLVRPLALVVKATPVACVVVVLLLWLGAEGVPVAAVALVVAPAYYFSTLEGVQQVRPEVADALRVMGVGPVRLWLAHGWPSVLPYLQATSKNAVGMAWKAGVAAELIAMALDTLGEKVYQAKLLLETPELFAWTATIILLAFLCEKAFLRLLAASGPAALSLAVSSAPSEPRDCAVSEDPTVRVSDLRVERGGTIVLDSVDLEVGGGEILCLRAPSGAGKTTLILAILGLVRPSAGRVERPDRASAVFQEVRLVEALSAEDNVRLVACGTPRETVRAALAELLPGVEPERAVSELSGGQRRRVEIVRAMLCPGAAVLMDEPFTGLDEAARESAIAFIRRQLRGRSLIIATHEADDVSALGAAVLEL